MGKDGSCVHVLFNKYLVYSFSFDMYQLFFNARKNNSPRSIACMGIMAGSVILKPFIIGQMSHYWVLVLYFKSNQHTIHDPKGREKYNYGTGTTKQRLKPPHKL